MERLNKRWGRVRLPKFGWVRFRWTRPLGGELRSATITCDTGRWHISFCVQDGIVEVTPNGLPPVGVDRGVVVAVATSDGAMVNREFVTPGEAQRLRRLQQQLARQRNKRSNRVRPPRRSLRDSMARSGRVATTSPHAPHTSSPASTASSRWRTCGSAT